MKSVFVLAMVIVAAIAEEDKTAQINIDDVINNPEQLAIFTKCFNHEDDCKGPLAGYQKQLKLAIEDACATCTPKEKHDLKKFLDGLKEKMPAEYAKFRKIYDPESKYFGPLEAAISA